SYNIRLAKAAISSGGLTGKGYLQGPMTAYGFVPEQETDFIFCTVGEEWGFIGSSVVLFLFFLLLARILMLAERQRSDFTRIYAYAVASILFMHVLINIGMVLGLAPVIGIPLPFMSAGGSSLLGFTLLVFILLRLDAERFTVLR
ncbi:MAG: rod shape-determining protein RodA, partial [Flavobacteriales bacterium]